MSSDRHARMCAAPSRVSTLASATSATDGATTHTTDDNRTRRSLWLAFEISSRRFNRHLLESIESPRFASIRLQLKLFFRIDESRADSVRLNSKKNCRPAKRDMPEDLTAFRMQRGTTSSKREYFQTSFAAA